MYSDRNEPYIFDTLHQEMLLEWIRASQGNRLSNIRQ